MSLDGGVTETLESSLVVSEEVLVSPGPPETTVPPGYGLDAPRRRDVEDNRDTVQRD